MFSAVRKTAASRPLLWLILCYTVFFDVLFFSAMAVDVEAPTIEPSSNTFVGEVVVTIVPNQPHSFTYFTLNGQKPSDRDDIFVKGTEIVLGEPGRYLVSAVTYSKINVEMLTPSQVVTMEYNITPAVLPRPVADPPSDQFGRYFRGGVSIKLLHAPSLMNDNEITKNLRIRYLVSYIPTLSTYGTSGALPPPALNSNWTVFSGEELKLKNPGTYILRVQAYDESVRPSLFSPRNRLVYRVRPPLVYDVSTECCGSYHQPVVGQFFTIWLSNAVKPSSIFLSTSAKGCELNKNILGDTTVRSVEQRQKAFHFITCVGEQPRVFVCLKEENDLTHRVVPRRYSFLKDGNSNAFSVSAPEDKRSLRAVNCSISENFASSNESVSQGENNGGLWLFILFSGCCAWMFGMIIYVRKFWVKASASRTNRRSHMRSDRTDRIELLPKDPSPLVPEECD